MMGGKEASGLCLFYRLHGVQVVGGSKCKTEWHAIMIVSSPKKENNEGS